MQEETSTIPTGDERHQADHRVVGLDEEIARADDVREVGLRVRRLQASVPSESASE